jgi:hypothetical protein
MSSPVRADPQTGFGLMCGAVLASHSFDFNTLSGISTHDRWGFDTGFYVEAISGPLFSLSTELHYVQKGFSSSAPVTTAYQPEGTGESMTIRPRIDYLSFPVLVKARFATLAFAPYLIAGPRLDVLVGHSGLDYLYDHLKIIDIGASLGAGLAYSTDSTLGFLAEFRWSPSFTNIFDNGSLTVKNRSFEFLAGVRFGL